MKESLASKYKDLLIILHEALQEPTNEEFNSAENGWQFALNHNSDPEECRRYLLLQFIGDRRNNLLDRMNGV